MNRIYLLLLVIPFILITGLLFQHCSSVSKKKIVYINSYHKGHPSSDEIMDGFIKNMPADSFDIYSYYMDTKRNPSKEFIEKRAAQLFDSIVTINPDILIVSDDNAVKYIVELNFSRLSMPIVFCGVNWTDKEYNLPSNQVTGILEILPVANALLSIKSIYSSAEKLLILSENTTTSRKDEQILDTLFQRIGVKATYNLVDDFEQWKTAFYEANQYYDIIYIPTHAAIKGWNHEEALRFISQNIKIPIFTCEDFMMPYAVFGVTKIAEEHGVWAAGIAKKIASGSSPADFPVTRNHESTKWLNTRLAEKIRFYPDTDFMKNIRILDE